MGDIPRWSDLPHGSGEGGVIHITVDCADCRFRKIVSKPAENAVQLNFDDKPEQQLTAAGQVAICVLGSHWRQLHGHAISLRCAKLNNSLLKLHPFWHEGGAEVVKMGIPTDLFNQEVLDQLTLIYFRTLGAYGERSVPINIPDEQALNAIYFNLSTWKLGSRQSPDTEFNLRVVRSVSQPPQNVIEAYVTDSLLLTNPENLQASIRKFDQSISIYLANQRLGLPLATSASFR